jgi:outer membrane protein assembly factor BamB
LAITKPDGTKETIPYTGTTSQVGSAWITYTPDQVGDYTIVFSWPGQTHTNGTGAPNLAGLVYVGDFFEGSTSAPAKLTVQQEPIAEWVEPPLPDYWTRPLNAANREWSQLASNWLKGSQHRYTNFQEYGKAPNSPHIVWAQPLSFGGITDARWPGNTYGTMDYEFPWLWSPPIIMNGQVFLNNPVYPKYGYYAVDLQTGEQLWRKNGTDNGLKNPVVSAVTASGGAVGPALTQTFPQLSFGQLYYYHSVNGEGMAAYLWMTQSLASQLITPDMLDRLTQEQLDRLTPAQLDELRGGRSVTVASSTMWYMLDATTGNWILTLKNVPSGTSVTDQDGSLLLYTYSSTTGRFLAWNSSQSIPPGGPTGTAQEQWKPMVGATIDAVNDTLWTQWGPSGVTSGTVWFADDILPRSGYTMNVTGPTGLPGLSAVLRDENRVPKLMFFSDFLNLPRFGSSEMTFRAAAVRIDEHVAPYSPFPDKTFTQNNNLGFGVTLLWNKTITKPMGGNLTFSLGPVSYEDKVFTVWCKETMQWWGYSLDTGELLWGPTASQPSWDMYGSGGFYAYGKLFSGSYGGVLHAYDIKTGKLLWNYTATGIGRESPYGNYQLSLSAVADGKIYMTSGEHSPSKPYWRGSYLRAINATDGTEIWKIQDFNMGLGVADGYIVGGNMYDTQLYSIGKGPSATTVEAPTTAITQGSSVVIRGTVTDQSPGAKELSQLRGFSVAAIADADMQAWMEYLYMQQAMPTNAKGVEVTLDTIDPNGNFVHIGTVTSDLTGAYGYMFTPEVPGKYTIIATFAGSESYGSSYAETAIGVTEAPSASPTPPPLTLPPTEMYIAGATIAIIIAIAIVGILLFRKR